MHETTMPTGFLEGRTATTEDFELFKTECLKWLDFFGILDKRVYFQWSDDHDNNASCGTDKVSSMVTLALSKTLTLYTEQDLKNTALHEASHALVGDLWDLSWDRHATEEELKKTCEALVNRIENIILKLLKRS